MAFIVAGVVTVLFALLVRLTVGEPPRTIEGGSATRGRVRESLRLMWQDRVLRQVWAGSVITAAVGFGALNWLPSYLGRSHQLSLTTIGVYLALVVGLGGALGSWLGGHYSDALRRRDVRWSLWLVAAVFIGSKPFSIAFYLLDNTALALTLFAIPAAVGGIFMGPAVAVLHDRVPAALRPIVSAIFLMFINFIGLGLGPLLTGALSQYVFGSAGEHSLRYALVVIQLLGIWGGVHFWLAGRHLRAA
jgi:MFS family permease